VNADTNILQEQVKDARVELELHLPLILREKGPECAEPLRVRVVEFLQLAEPRLAQLRAQVDAAEKLINKTLAK
jgi:hypothetical protein